MVHGADGVGIHSMYVCRVTEVARPPFWPVYAGENGEGRRGGGRLLVCTRFLSRFEI